MTGQDRPPDRFHFREAALNALAFLGAAALAAIFLFLAAALGSWALRIFFGRS